MGTIFSRVKLSGKQVFALLALMLLSAVTAMLLPTALASMIDVGVAQENRSAILIIAAVMAVLAGNDMVLTTDFETQIPEVIQAVEDGTIPMEQVDQSVSRILSWKYDLGLLGH